MNIGLEIERALALGELHWECKHRMLKFLHMELRPFIDRPEFNRNGMTITCGDWDLTVRRRPDEH